MAPDERRREPPMAPDERRREPPMAPDERQQEPPMAPDERRREPPMVPDQCRPESAIARDDPHPYPRSQVETFAHLASQITTRVPRLGRVRLVAIDGPSGAGKTWFADRLAKHLNAPVVHTDDLLSGWDDQFTFWDRLEEQVLEPLRRGQRARYRRYLWDQQGFGGETVTVEPADVVLMEGFSSARRVIRPELTFAIFVTAPPDLRLSRVLARDGGTDLAFRAYLERWRSAEDRHFATDATAAYADLVVDGAAQDCGEEYEQLWRRPPS
jgi:uridine kinase